MPDPVWPLLDLRIRVGDLDLRPVDDVDQRALAALLPDDVELDPAATRFTGLPEADQRALVVRQTYWRAYGTWSADSWALPFAVRHAGTLIGEQTLEGEQFPLLRTVDSASWLVPDARGRGHGKAMRRGVLALAFGPLEALAAITSAWQDNAASLGVSRALGYRPNGEHLHARDDGVDTMVHLRLTREQWLAGGHDRGVEVAGARPCLPLFGL